MWTFSTKPTLDCTLEQLPVDYGSLHFVLAMPRFRSSRADSLLISFGSEPHNGRFEMNNRDDDLCFQLLGLFDSNFSDAFMTASQ